MPASERFRLVEPRRPAPRPVRGRRILLAHAPTATCDALAVTIEAAMPDMEIVDTSSVDDARLAVATECFDACLICLDLPPAPLGGVRLASELMASGHSVVLVTRSLRWVPADKPALQQLPWITPDAGAAEVAGAIAAASGEFDSMIRARAPSVNDLLSARAARLRR
jgi:hypothetical protein